jgi:type IX secretion system PorP/SprF family membrane protein
MNKIITSLAFLLCGTAFTYGQQDPQFSMNMYNKLSVNPGYAGSNDAICATLLARDQWVGFPGNPKTGLISGEMPLPVIHGGVGLTLTSDALGFDKVMNVKAAYAFRTDLGPGKIALGVAAGILQKSTNGDWVYNQPNDPTIPMSRVSGTVPDFDLGLYYHTTDLYFGFSSTHLSEASIDYGKIQTSLARHYFVMAGYNYKLNTDWTLKPSVFIKSDAASTQLDVNLTALYNNKFWGGVSYRVQDAIVAMVGMQVTPNIKFGYAYDITTSEIKNYSGGSHELMLGYCFKLKGPTVINKNHNVRFL